MDDPRVGQIADDLLLPGPCHLDLRNLQGSSPAFLLSALYRMPKAAGLNHLVILPDAEEAAYFHNSVESLVQPIDLFYFPSSFKNKKNFRVLNSSHVMLRTEALTRISQPGNKKIIITYPEALAEKVVLPEQLARNIIFIRTNDTLDPDSLYESLV